MNVGRMLSSLGVLRRSSSVNTGNVDTKQYNVGQENFTFLAATVSVLLTASSVLTAAMATPSILCSGGSVITNASNSWPMWKRSDGITIKVKVARGELRVGVGLLTRGVRYSGAACIGVERRLRDRGHVGN